jgi:hypothetical protein
MNLPSQDEVLAATRHIASFAGGAVLMLGLGTRISPDTLTAIVNATGAVIGDTITLVGLITPIVAAYYASHAQTQTYKVQSVQAMPGVEKVFINAAATPALAALAVDPAVPKVEATAQTKEVVAAIAKNAA